MSRAPGLSSVFRCALNIHDEQVEKVGESFKKFIEQIPEGPQVSLNDKSYVIGKVMPSRGVQCQQHVLNVPVNYCSKALILTVPYTNPEYSKLRVLARLLTSKYLHPNLRERFGTYSGGSRLTTDGVFIFFSYRDPRNLQTLDVFDQTQDWLNKELNNITPQAIDAPIPPSLKGSNEFYLRLTPDVLQNHRAEIMSVENCR